MRTQVYKSTGNRYLVKEEGGTFVTARVRGKLRIDKEISTTNPVAVGDWVSLAADRDEEGVAVIDAIEPRENYMVRQAVYPVVRRHIIAANLDLAVLVCCLKKPFTSQGFTDRFLVTAEAYHIPCLIVFNKADQHIGNTLKALTKRKALYKNIGYETLETSPITGLGIEDLKERLKGKTCLFTGHSGVGKSTLINQLIPDLNLQTKAVSDSSEKGQHTTTFAQMYDWEEGSQIIDTPGIKELGLVDIPPAELSHYFPEMKTLLPDCHFNNCLHINEPQCAVKKALANGEISSERYESYLSLYERLSNR